MQINSITQLSSVDTIEKIQALNALGIYTLRDMAEYTACRHAEFVLACFKQGSLEDADLENYIEAEALTEENLSRLDELDIVYLISVSESEAVQLTSAFGVETLGQLAALPPYQEAQRIVLETIRGEFYEKPSAPQALIPRLIGSTHTQARFSNFVKEKEYRLDDYELTYFSDKDEPEPAAELINIFYRSEFKFYLGYLAAIHQKWINAGTHLGEILHSLALAPGESRNIAVLDWYRRQRSSRREDTTAAEELRAEFLQTRALNEVVQTTANEHLYGSTEVDATTKTTGAGLVGGKASGAATGGSVSTDLLALVGLPIKAASSALASTVNSIGGSLVYSNGSVQGTLKSETTGERTVTGEVVQNISDATVQNASNVRSVMSTVVVEDEQSGRQRALTRNVTNYNHSHALTIQYYEVLHSYRIDTTVDSLSPVLFLPFGPITFQIKLIKDYWYIFGRAIRRALPGRFIEYDQVVKDFNPQNEAFDASGDLRITRVKITRTRSYSEPIRVKLTDSNPEVTLAISGFDMDDCLLFKLTGNSTYISYDILDVSVNDLSEFGSPGVQNSGSVDSFEIDEGILSSLSSDFTAELKQTMKTYLDDEDKTPKVADTNRADNELGLGSNREGLKEDVDNNLFSILNNNASLDLTMDFEYTIEDKNGQVQTVFQTIHKTYTYGHLKGEIDEEIADVTAYINTQLATISDINPSDVITEIEQHFNFHKYGYTKYLLANVEKEQIIDIIDHLGLYGTTETLALSALIDPNPIGLTENLLIFRLREDGEELHQHLGKNFFSAVQAPLFGSDVTLSGHGLQQSTVRKGRSVRKYTLWGQPIPGKQGSNYSTANLTLYIDDRPQKGHARSVEGSIDMITNLGGRQFTNPVALQGTVNHLDDKSIQINYTASGAIPHGLEGNIDWTFDYPRPNGENVAGLAQDYIRSLQEYEAVVRKRHHRDTVFLPSSGVFAEAILGLSNASEYLNIRRFFNWQDSPIPNLAPAVQAVNLNQDYAQPIPGSLTPTVPVSVLNQIAPQQYPMPTSLTSALEAIQNGSMFTDMSKTSQLTTILGSLAELANNTAQLSGNLAGEAAANALNAAVALGQQVAAMVGSAMNTNIADPPETPTTQGIVVEYLDDIKHNSNGGPIAPTDQAGAGAVGAPIPSPSNGGGSGGNGTPSPSPSPSPSPTPTPQPEDTIESPYNTADSVSGTLTVLTAPPEPYKYVVMNVLAMLDEFIPQEVDDELASVYTTLKEFVISLGDDEAKKGAAIGLLKKLKPGLKAPGALMGIGLAVDLLTSETFIELAEGILILLYDFIYYFCFPYLEFAGVNDVGVWFDCEIDYTKPKGAAAQISTKTTNPFNFLYYRLGGSPNPNPPKDGWGIESLSGSWRIPLIDTDYQKIFTVEAVDQASGNDLTLRIDAELEVMVNLVQIIQALRENLMADLYETLNGLEAYAEEQLKQLVLAMINSLDERLLESMLQSLGFSSESIATIQAIIASGFELLGWVGGKLIDVNFLIANLALYCFDTITGFFYNLAYSPEFKYYLDLDLNLKYQSAYPERWTIQPEGHTTKFPQLTVTSNGQSGKVVEVYKKNDIDPTGLLSLLFPLDEIVTGKPKDL